MSENLFEDDTQTTTQPEMIAWPGGECPVAPRDLVLVEQRDGTRVTAEASTIAWNHLNVASDVMRWCMVEQRDEPVTTKAREVHISIPLPNVAKYLDLSMKFSLNQTVATPTGIGTVVGRSETTFEEPSYLVRKDVTGNLEAYSQLQLKQQIAD